MENYLFMVSTNEILQHQHTKWQNPIDFRYYSSRKWSVVTEQHELNSYRANIEYRVCSVRFEMPIAQKDSSIATKFNVTNLQVERNARMRSYIIVNYY